MSIFVEIKPQAIEDINGIASYIAKDSLKAQINFIKSTKSAIDRISRFPQLGARKFIGHTTLSEVRMLSVPHFQKIQIIYRFENDRLDILRVIHSARNIEQLLDSTNKDTS